MMRLRTILLFLLALTGCGDDGPCERLNRCCDVFVSDPLTDITCFREGFPSDDAACEASLAELPPFAAEQGIALPDECTE